MSKINHVFEVREGLAPECEKVLYIGHSVEAAYFSLVDHEKCAHMLIHSSVDLRYRQVVDQTEVTPASLNRAIDKGEQVLKARLYSDYADELRKLAYEVEKLRLSQQYSNQELAQLDIVEALQRMAMDMQRGGKLSDE